MKPPDKDIRTLIAAAVTAVVTVTAAVLVLMSDTDGPSGARTADARPQVPTVAWTLDAARYLGRPFGEFSDPRGGASYQSGNPGLLRIQNTIVTIAGSPTEQYVLGDAVMIGIEPDSGRVRWRAPAADIEGCSATPIRGKLYCYASDDAGRRAIVTYDIRTGRSMRRAVNELVFAIATSSDTLYTVEGDPEDSDVRVHSGTYDDISAHWTKPFDLFTTWDGAYEGQVLSVTDGVGLLQLGGQMAQFATDTGSEIWRSTDYRVRSATLEPGGVVVRSGTDRPSGTTVVAQTLARSDGKVLASTTSPAVQTGVDLSSNPERPVVMGDGAYDRDSGKRLWSAPDLAADRGETVGTVTAITGHVLYLRDADGGESGLDLRSGKRLWHNPTALQFTPRAADGDQIVGDDGQALTAFDAATGRAVWTLSFAALDPDPETFRTGGAAQHSGDTWIYSSDRRIIGVRVR